MDAIASNGTAYGQHVATAAPRPRPTSAHVGTEWAVRVAREVSKAIVGQEIIIERALVALLVDGHVLLEGMPGVAKTLLVKSLGAALGLRFERIQFTPDLLPSDVVGTMVFQPQRGEFTTHLGPIVANLVLADEINRAPAKVQSALLEAMQEHQVTIGGQSHALPRPFLVMATQNPIEQEGTYPLPEAQTDRFLFKLLVDYPSEDAEHRMLKRWGQVTEQPSVDAVSSPAELLALRAAVDAVYVGEELQRYILALVRATRAAAAASSGGPILLSFGASPRATLALVQAARGLAFVRGLDYATPAIVQEIFCDAVRHRIGMTYEAEAEQIRPDHVLQRIIKTTPVPERVAA